MRKSKTRKNIEAIVALAAQIGALVQDISWPEGEAMMENVSEIRWLADDFLTGIYDAVSRTDLCPQEKADALLPYILYEETECDLSEDMPPDLSEQDIARMICDDDPMGFPLP